MFDRTCENSCFFVSSILQKRIIRFKQYFYQHSTMQEKMKNYIRNLGELDADVKIFIKLNFPAEARTLLRRNSKYGKKWDKMGTIIEKVAVRFWKKGSKILEMGQ